MSDAGRRYDGVWLRTESVHSVIHDPRSCGMAHNVTDDTVLGGPHSTYRLHERIGRLEMHLGKPSFYSIADSIEISLCSNVTAHHR